jgi:N-acetylglucosamine-6-phosphate deacetylase
MPQLLTARRLILPDQTIDHPRILIDDGIVQSIEPGKPTGDDTTLAPTFLDIHTHGAAGHDVMEATPDALAKVGGFLATRGVGRYLPTTVTAPIDPTLRALEGLANVIESTQHMGAVPIGIHLEGPFISHVKRGVHPPVDILPPSIELFDRFQQAARGHIRLMTIAPETPGAIDLIAHAVANGVRISLGHSNANTVEAKAGVAAGATSATHTFNAMRPLDHRDPGILGVVLDDDRLYAELICDGIHMAPELVRLWLKSKGAARGILVTDSMSATGMPDGDYMLGGFVATVANGRAMSNGALAGSVLTMDRAVANVQAYTGASLATAIQLASNNPAFMLGESSDIVGKPVSLNRFSANGELQSSIIAEKTFHL